MCLPCWIHRAAFVRLIAGAGRVRVRACVRASVRCVCVSAKEGVMSDLGQRCALLSLLSLSLSPSLLSCCSPSTRRLLLCAASNSINRPRTDRTILIPAYPAIFLSLLRTSSYTSSFCRQPSRAFPSISRFLLNCHSHGRLLHERIQLYGLRSTTRDLAATFVLLSQVFQNNPP